MGTELPALSRRSLLLGASALGCLIPFSTARSLPAQSTSTDADELQSLFDGATAGSTIRIPPREHVLEGYILLPQAPDVTIIAAGATFTGGSARFYSGGHSGLTWRGGRFAGDGTKALCFAFLGSTDYVFEHIEFDQVQPFGWHLFDLIGCTNFTFKALDVCGYGNTTDLSATSVYSLYKEAIQLDYAYTGASGGAGLNDLLEAAGGTFDGSASTDITVEHSTFAAARDDDGIVSWAPCPMGQHAYSPDEQNARIRFVRNVVSDAIPLNSLSGGAWPRGALSFVPIVDLEVTGNRFEATVPAAQRENWIQIVSNSDGRLPDPSTMLPSSGIAVTDNRFGGFAPTRAYVRLESDMDHPNYRISDVIVSGNHSACGESSPTWVERIGIDSQFSDIVVSDNKAMSSCPEPSDA
ncbi:MAG TPA: hypothetical protein H9815_07585 [Candidatus Ruania gallistercoris]|uniref:Uncharacterized protein n=1 Tax=Candidatus Ruania gallistercoris TaxID=2838746 RepID=A0A9D2EE31_9MICO|nr:hypothetical protein [Candidatus Ruania gallistercoris]